MKLERLALTESKTVIGQLIFWLLISPESLTKVQKRDLFQQAIFIKTILHFLPCIKLDTFIC
jgi:hypothetical protein